MFDASKVYDLPPLSAKADADTRLEQMSNPLGIPANKASLEQQLRELEYRLNFQAWGHWPQELPAPTQEQGAELLKRLSSRSFERDAIGAAAIRYMLRSLSQINTNAKVKQEKEWDRQLEVNAEKNDREAFEAHEASDREKRFQQWRKQR